MAVHVRHSDLELCRTRGHSGVGESELMMNLLCSFVGSDGLNITPQMNIFLYVLSSRASCSPRLHSLEKEPHV